MPSVDVWFLVVSATIGSPNPGMIGPIETQEACEVAKEEYKYKATFCAHAYERIDCGPNTPPDQFCPMWKFSNVKKE